LKSNQSIVLEGKGITKIYGDLLILKGVDISLGKNESICLLGMSGSGKTTLIGILAGLLPPSEGKVLIDKQDPYDVSTGSFERSRLIGLIFQNFALLENFTVIENLIVAHWILHPDYEICRKKATNLLKIVGLELHMSKFPNQLSSGQKQRVGVARALINDPKIILADEPTGSLDSENSQNIMSMITTIAKENRAVIFCTHNIEIAKYAGRILMLKDGLLIPVEKSMLDKSKSILELYKLAKL
jgi:ABC-type lipoprotein export system ATPase subunit